MDYFESLWNFDQLVASVLNSLLFLAMVFCLVVFFAAFQHSDDHIQFDLALIRCYYYYDSDVVHP